MIGDYRKFYKIDGLNTVFPFEQENPSVYNTNLLLDDESLEANGVIGINTDTILFITASSEDEGKFVRINFFEEINEEDLPVFYTNFHKISKGDTMIWAKNSLFSISSTFIKNITTSENGYKITYSDGGESSLPYFGEESELDGVFPIVVDYDKKKVYLYGNEQENNFNLIFNLFAAREGYNPDLNNANNNSKVVMIGRGNIASTDEQIIFGKFNYQDNSKKFIIGNGDNENNRKNIFSISETGTVVSPEDFVIPAKDSNPVYRLSDIHSVTDDDWIWDGPDYTSFSGDFSNDYTIPEEEKFPFNPENPDIDWSENLEEKPGFGRK